ncbi:dihydrofolate reductase family protein [Corynebacterium sp. TAE3-ERU12]|uniref:dihydrofolate reductase family protein n=1 Tax=Corynebacterium sp. TAE3-ERU12 TaxID=2849491 RepID=UPI001C46B67B|nr:dihydrofolate reductase family protein [Corynebacterium sp. TAE3-ERU12]MBV7295338.1 dihydrofolate reductase family protein [Corynebacterium sp. TAE3-ERU12]
MHWIGEISSETIGTFISPSTPIRGCTVPPASVRLVAVTSLNGAGAIDGTSGALGNDTDSAIFTAIREEADVIIVGADTAVAEDYGTCSATPMLVLSRSLDLVDWAHSLDTTATNCPEIITTTPHRDTTQWRINKQKIENQGVTVTVLADTEPQNVLDEITRRGFHTIALEGGPTLYGLWLESGVVTEVFLTLAPVFVGNTASLIQFPNAEGVVEKLTLAALGVSDSHLFLRYQRT